MAYTTTPASPGFVSIVSDLDISQELSDDTVAQLRQTWLQSNGVMIFRNQDLTPAQHVAFSRRFGTLLHASAHPSLAKYFLKEQSEIFIVSNKKVNGEPVGREDAGTYWHSDGSWAENPPTGSLLFSREIPPVGGDTLFADMYRAYDTLSPPMQTMLEGLNAVHSLGVAALKTSYAKDLGGQLETAFNKQATHPVVRRHPESGRKALFVNPGFTSHIEGLSASESAAVLDLLFEHSTQPANLYRHVWQLHDLVMWDNRAVMHYAVSNYKAYGDRYMHRTTLLAPA